MNFSYLYDTSYQCMYSKDLSLSVAVSFSMKKFNTAQFVLRCKGLNIRNYISVQIVAVTEEIMNHIVLFNSSKEHYLLKYMLQ